MAAAALVFQPLTVPANDILRVKWEAALQVWAVYRTGTGARVSSAYDPPQYQRTTSTGGTAAVLAEVQVVDRLLQLIRSDRRHGGERVANALREWVLDEGSRGDQAARLSVHVDTYRALVDSGIVWLERLSRAGRSGTSKAPPPPQRNRNDD
ncbi:MAG TPA: hypothetical protein VJQ42_02125 [Rhodanobacteraceae bacterium]|nr:hypothetical protein [Rhodanobacteraceae bacterium]